MYKIITRFLSTISMSLVAKELHKLFQAIKGDVTCFCCYRHCLREKTNRTTFIQYKHDTALSLLYQFRVKTVWKSLNNVHVTLRAFWSCAMRSIHESIILIQKNFRNIIFTIPRMSTISPTLTLSVIFLYANKYSTVINKYNLSKLIY